MSPKVVVVDSGMGNVFSICNALKRCGADVTLSASVSDILAAPRLVLPGVGAFKDGMAALRERSLDEAVLAFADKSRPLIGICLGMQILLETGEEFGQWPGLNLIPGKGVKIPEQSEDGSKHKIPQIGWNGIFPPEGRETAWKSSILSGTLPNSMVYFVHSYHAVPQDPAHILAFCDYHGVKVTAAVKKDNVFGCQFHPEKSGPIGLGIFNQFLEC